MLLMTSTDCRFDSAKSRMPPVKLFSHTKKKSVKTGYRSMVKLSDSSFHSCMAGLKATKHKAAKLQAIAFSFFFFFSIIGIDLCIRICWCLHSVQSAPTSNMESSDSCCGEKRQPSTLKRINYVISAEPDSFDWLALRGCVGLMKERLKSEFAN